MNTFEEKVLLGLKQCNIELKTSQNLLKLGVAVSGGADSISLLFALAGLSKKYPLELKVISVNHFIRPDEETCRDADFVQKTCKDLINQNYPVTCTIIELEKGEVLELAERAKIGVEAAARNLRYKAFTNFILEEKLDYLCLAHNLNDQLETLLMRFLQGAGVDHCGGIPLCREKFVRPLLNITRDEIEIYLKEKNQNYCTDSTNSDTKYLRNNIRNNLVPFLNEHFEGWSNSVLTGGKKAVEDGKLISEMVNSFLEAYPITNNDEEICIELQQLKKCEKAVQRRVLMHAVNIALGKNGEERIPFAFMDEVLSLLDNEKKGFCKSYNQIEIIEKNNKLYIKKCIKLNTDLCFSVIIHKDGVFELPFGTVELSSIDNKNHLVNINGHISECRFSYPVCLRSITTDDYILSASNSLKKVSIILKDWKVPIEKKALIPVIQELAVKEQPLICILGKFLGFKDWILRK